jgi:hypothetical protein
MEFTRQEQWEMYQEQYPEQPVIMKLVVLGLVVGPIRMGSEISWLTCKGS